MRTISTMCFEITNMATQTDAIHEIISNYVNILSSEEIFFALEGVTIQELMEIINQHPSDELCCSFHKSQLILKCLILHRLFVICKNKLQQLNIIDEGTGS